MKIEKIDISESSDLHGLTMISQAVRAWEGIQRQDRSDKLAADVLTLLNKSIALIISKR